MRVLLVEDNCDDVELTRQSLRDTPYEFVHVETLGDAIRWMHSETADAVLFDLTLSDSDGTRGVEQLASRFPHTPIVVLTGSADDELVEKSLRAGAEDHLVKGSIDADRLARALRYAIERRRLHRELDAERRRRREANELAALAGERLEGRRIVSDLVGGRGMRSARVEDFARLARFFTDIVLDGLQQQAYKVDRNTTGRLRQLTTELAELGAGPRDVIDVYEETLSLLRQESMPKKRFLACVTEGRLLLLELMGNLVAHYRVYATSLPWSSAVEGK